MFLEIDDGFTIADQMQLIVDLRHGYRRIGKPANFSVRVGALGFEQMDIGLDGGKVLRQRDILCDHVRILHTDAGHTGADDRNDRDSTHQPEREPQAVHVVPIRRNFA